MRRDANGGLVIRDAAAVAMGDGARIAAAIPVAYSCRAPPSCRLAFAQLTTPTRQVPNDDTSLTRCHQVINARMPLYHPCFRRRAASCCIAPRLSPFESMAFALKNLVRRTLVAG